MKENQDDYFSLIDVIRTVKSFFTYLKKRWWFLLLIVCGGFIIGFTYYKFQKPKYKAVTTFILEEKSSSGGFAGLASQFGLNLGGLSGGGSIFAGDNILDILKSKKVVQQVLLSHLNPNDTTSKTLADHYLEFTNSKVKWKNHPQLSLLNFKQNFGTLSPLQDSVLNCVYERILKNELATERLTKQGTIIQVQVTSADQLFARLMTERLVEEAGNLYQKIKTGTAKENIDKLQRRSDSLLYLLNRKSYATAANQPLDINPGIKTAVVPLEIASRDKTVMAALYTEVTKNLEASKLLLSQQTPVIQLLDQPAILLDDNKKGILFLMAAFGFGAAFVYTFFAFVAFWLSRNNMH